MAETMVDRVAKAIYEVDGGKGWHLHSQFYLDSARAAISAMNEPDKRTLDALVARMHDARFSEPGEEYPVARNFVRSFIDAALSEGGGQ